jgi:hypothetical protein
MFLTKLSPSCTTRSLAYFCRSFQFSFSPFVHFSDISGFDWTDKAPNKLIWCSACTEALRKMQKLQKLQACIQVASNTTTDVHVSWEPCLTADDVHPAVAF